MTASKVLEKYEDMYEYHFHDSDRKFIIEAMEEYKRDSLVKYLYFERYRSNNGDSVLQNINCLSIRPETNKYGVAYKIITDIKGYLSIIYIDLDKYVENIHFDKDVKYILSYLKENL